MLEPAHTDSGQLIVPISSQLHVQQPLVEIGHGGSIYTMESGKGYRTFVLQRAGCSTFTSIPVVSTLCKGLRISSLHYYPSPQLYAILLMYFNSIVNTINLPFSWGPVGFVTNMLFWLVLIYVLVFSYAWLPALCLTFYFFNCVGIIWDLKWFYLCPDKISIFILPGAWVCQQPGVTLT